MRRLPPLATLRAFEAAARHLSFKVAAEELGVTPTAISHQIRLLEDTLGLRLFERQARRVFLTVPGQELYPVLRDGFDDIARVLQRLAARRGRRAVTLSATTAFMARWLVPRVAAFGETNPGYDLRLHASDQPVDFHAGTADAAIRYGHGPYPGLVCERLITDRFAPVCSPRLPLRRPEDLAGLPLIHFEWRHYTAGTPTWRLWLERAGLSGIDPTRGITFSDETHAIQAALAGQGAALVSLLLVADEIAAGGLIQPFGPILAGYNHHLVFPEGADERDEIVALRSWLREIALAG